MKKILFIITFFIGIAIFFPFNKVVSYYVNEAIEKNKINISYTNLDSSPFETKLFNVSYKNLEFSSIIIKHNPFSYLISKKVSLLIYSNLLNGEINKIKNNVNFKFNLDLAMLKKFIRKINISGQIKITGKIDILKKIKGKIKILSKEINYKDKKWGNVKFKKVQGVFIVENNIINIKNLISSEIPLNISGKIFLNTSNINKSRLNLKGEIKFAGMKNKFRIKGTLQSPKIY